jgi:3-hydroxybutyryl-CoA dehydrogenase
MSANFAYTNTRDLEFILQEWLPTEQIFNYPRFVDYYSKDDIKAFLNPILKMCKEVIVENMEIKKSLFKQLDEICKPDAILASNTSSLSVSELANVTKRPDKFIGMHFFNPVQMMKLIEVVRPLQVSSDTENAIMELSRKLGKEPVPVKDSPGFVVNRILAMGSGEVPFMLQEGVATPEAIDKCMKLGANWRMGPCELGDFVGIDISMATRLTLYKEFGEDKYRPCLLTTQMIRAGFLGRKTGKGYYIYDEEGNNIGNNPALFK